MESSDWIRLASEIELNYSFFDAFLILSGTDTIWFVRLSRGNVQISMFFSSSYTTSALSFLLEDLGKTVVSSRYSNNQ
jgi:60kDa lysophospholipase